MYSGALPEVRRRKYVTELMSIGKLNFQKKMPFQLNSLENKDFFRRKILCPIKHHRQTNGSIEL